MQNAMYRRMSRSRELNWDLLYMAYTNGKVNAGTHAYLGVALVRQVAGVVDLAQVDGPRAQRSDVHAQVVLVRRRGKRERVVLGAVEA